LPVFNVLPFAFLTVKDEVFCKLPYLFCFALIFYLNSINYGVLGNIVPWAFVGNSFIN